MSQNDSNNSLVEMLSPHNHKVNMKTLQLGMEVLSSTKKTHTRKSSRYYYTDASWWPKMLPDIQTPTTIHLRWISAIARVFSHRISTVSGSREILGSQVAYTVMMMVIRLLHYIYYSIRWWCCGTVIITEIDDTAEILHPVQLYQHKASSGRRLGGYTVERLIRRPQRSQGGYWYSSCNLLVTKTARNGQRPVVKWS